MIGAVSGEPPAGIPRNISNPSPVCFKDLLIALSHGLHIADYGPAFTFGPLKLDAALKRKSFLSGVNDLHNMAADTMVRISVNRDPHVI
jgi:hypothetical protein